MAEQCLPKLPNTQKTIVFLSCGQGKLKTNPYLKKESWNCIGSAILTII